MPITLKQSISLHKVPGQVYNFYIKHMKELDETLKARVYITNTCPYCTMMTNYLKEHDISFEEVNVQEDQAAAQKLVAETGEMGVPQTKLNGKWIVGFNPDEVQNALKG